MQRDVCTIVATRLLIWIDTIFVGIVPTLKVTVRPINRIKEVVKRSTCRGNQFVLLLTNKNFGLTNNVVANLIELDGLFASDERHGVLEVKIGLGIVIDAVLWRVEVACNIN